MKKLILIFALIPLMAFAQYGQRGSGGGSTFYWSLTGQAQKTDSLRIIQGTNMTITQSGNTVTFNGAAGAGSTANVRANVGWTSNGTTAQDTLATIYRLNGKANIRFIVTDTDGDTLWFYPQNLHPFVLKDGANILMAVDSTGRAGFGTSTSGQARRAYLNVIGFSDTLVTVVGSSDKGLGDSLLTVLADGSLNLYHNRDGAQVSFLSKNISTATNATNEIRIATDGSALMQIGLQSTTNTGSYSALLTGDGGFIRTSSAADFLGFLAGTDNAPIAFAAGNIARLWLTKDSTISYKPLAVRGTITRKDTKALPAGAWLATASNGAALSSSNYMVTYAFDQTTAETLTVDFSLPPTFLQVTSVELEFVSPNTDGDSVGFVVAWLGRATDEALNVAFSSPLSGQLDLGTTANVKKVLTISGTFSNLAASDRLIFKIWRDPSAANNVAADVHFVEMRVNGNGLLH